MNPYESLCCAAGRAPREDPRGAERGADETHATDEAHEADETHHTGGRNRNRLPCFALLACADGAVVRDRIEEIFPPKQPRTHGT